MTEEERIRALAKLGKVKDKRGQAQSWPRLTTGKVYISDRTSEQQLQRVVDYPTPTDLSPRTPLSPATIALALAQQQLAGHMSTSDGSGSPMPSSPGSPSTTPSSALLRRRSEAGTPLGGVHRSVVLGLGLRSSRHGSADNSQQSSPVPSPGGSRAASPFPQSPALHHHNSGGSSSGVVLGQALTMSRSRSQSQSFENGSVSNPSLLMDTSGSYHSSSNTPPLTPSGLAARTAQAQAAASFGNGSSNARTVASSPPSSRVPSSPPLGTPSLSRTLSNSNSNNNSNSIGGITPQGASISPSSSPSSAGQPIDASNHHSRRASATLAMSISDDMLSLLPGHAPPLQVTLSQPGTGVEKVLITATTPLVSDDTSDEPPAATTKISHMRTPSSTNPLTLPSPINISNMDTTLRNRRTQSSSATTSSSVSQPSMLPPSSAVSPPLAPTSASATSSSSSPSLALKNETVIASSTHSPSVDSNTSKGASQNGNGSHDHSHSEYTSAEDALTAGDARVVVLTRSVSSSDRRTLVILCAIAVLLMAGLLTLHIGSTPTHT
jgi:hypothetical protein